MENVIIFGYFAIGVILMFYWWSKYYEKAYEEAKESEDGVDESMSVLFLTFLVTFWPIVLVYRFIKRYI